ncbi:hypothetical protein [Bacillus wiedmannii]|uniref:hypothetical protein n=1 Tax=Bacillus wiedmannii TaxID=1890302 RepID=UPI002E1CF029|nr:hypothetical protein [Bacillus wiedmannii]
MEAACSECEGDGASDVEALFASQEEAKPPNILAAGTRLKKVEASRSECEGDGASERENANTKNGSNKGL